MSKKRLIILVIGLAVLAALVSISLAGWYYSSKNRVTMDGVAGVIAYQEIEEWNISRAARWGGNKDCTNILSEAQVNQVNQQTAELYIELKRILVTPPVSGPNGENYSLPNAEKSLKDYDALGMKIGALIDSLDDNYFETHGSLLFEMFDLCWVDYFHIPYAIKHNNGREIYWAEMHDRMLKVIKDCLEEGNLTNDGEENGEGDGDDDKTTE